MSKPSFENIDRWFFEYSEGNLSPSQMEQLENFVAANPELKSEMEIWNNARVSPEKLDVASDSFIRPLPFFATKTALVGIGAFLLIGGFLLFDNLNSKELYKVETADLEIISVEDDDFFKSLYINNQILDKENGTLNRSDKHLSNTEKEQNGSQNTNDFDKISVNKEEKYKKNDFVEETLSDNVALFEKESDNRSIYFAEKNVKMEAEGLTDVVAFLKRDQSDEIAIAEKRKGNSLDMSQNSFKRKMNKLLRKIKRMSDQPIALKNTKDQYFHVPMMTGYNANFGMVGSVIGNRIQTTARNQWVGEENQQLMNEISWDGYVYALRGGLGVDVNYNNYANNTLQDFSASLTYSPKFSVNKNVSIEPAIRFKMGAINVDKKSPLIGSNIEVSRNSVLPLFEDGGSPIGSQLWYRDVGAGLLLNTKWFYAGVNLDNIGQHYNNFYSSSLNEEYQADLHLTSVIGTEYQSLTKDFRIAGYLLYQKYGELNEVWAGANFQWKFLQIGAASNTNLGFGASVGMRFDKFSLHYNLDNTYSRLNNQKLLSHQVTMRFMLKPNRYAAKFLNM